MHRAPSPLELHLSGHTLHSHNHTLHSTHNNKEAYLHPWDKVVEAAVQQAYP